MSQAMVVAVTAIYCLTALSESQQGRPGLALTFAAYALANVGLIWTMNAQ